MKEQEEQERIKNRRGLRTGGGGGEEKGQGEPEHK